jgi:hypothetical protein
MIIGVARLPGAFAEDLRVIQDNRSAPSFRDRLDAKLWNKYWHFMD